MKQRSGLKAFFNDIKRRQVQMKNILIVDDSRSGLAEIKALLSDEYNVMPVLSGAQALKYLSIKKPDLILLDVFMPDMDGFEVIKQIKADERTADIPVIFLTADISPEMKLKCCEAGAEDYAAKPIVPAALKRRISRILELYDLRAKLAEVGAVGDKL